jgi:uncharacterized membrane protein
MKILKKIGYITCLALFLTIVIGLVAQPVTAAPKEPVSISYPSPVQEKPQEQIKLNCKFPVLSATAGSSYEFEVELLYTGGDKPRDFELKATAPDGFTYQISRTYGGGANIAAIQLDPTKTYPETIKVTVAPYSWLALTPGEYKTTVEAASGTITGSIELKAVVTAVNKLTLETPQGALNTQVTAGKDNYFSFKVTNTGTAALDKINFSQSVRGGPSGWNVTFDPKTIESLPVDSEREVQVNIKPPEKTIAGDYQITITAKTESNNASDNFDIRVTVLTPTIWGWVGIAIVVIVVIGLVAMFWRLGRR